MNEQCSVANFALPMPPDGEQMKHTSAYIIILTGLIAVLFAANNAVVSVGYALPVTSPADGREIVPADVAIDPPADIVYPEPSYLPVLRPYVINKSHDIWHAQEPTTYIAPQNDWVKFYASMLYINDEGRILYKYMKVPLLADKDGNIISWTDKPFLNNYISDDDGFDNPPDDDMWVMPDYYLTNGMRDDCDGWAVTVASLLRSGEISVRQDERFIKKMIPAKVVLGYMKGYRDAWVEYEVKDMSFYTTTALIESGGKQKKSITIFGEKKNKPTVIPVFEFTDKYFGKYSGS